MLPTKRYLIIRWKDTGRDRLIGHSVFEYETENEAQKALTNTKQRQFHYKYAERKDDGKYHLIEQA